MRAAGTYFGGDRERHHPPTLPSHRHSNPLLSSLLVPSPTYPSTPIFTLCLAFKHFSLPRPLPLRSLLLRSLFPTPFFLSQLSRVLYISISYISPFHIFPIPFLSSVFLLSLFYYHCFYFTHTFFQSTLIFPFSLFPFYSLLLSSPPFSPLSALILTFSLYIFLLSYTSLSIPFSVSLPSHSFRSLLHHPFFPSSLHHHI